MNSSIYYAIQENNPFVTDYTWKSLITSPDLTIVKPLLNKYYLSFPYYNYRLVKAFISESGSERLLEIIDYRKSRKF